MTAIQDAVQLIASSAQLVRDLSDTTVEEAIDRAIKSTRSVSWRRSDRAPSRRDWLDANPDWALTLSVCADAENNISRPSTGPVRDAVRALVR